MIENGENVENVHINILESFTDVKDSVSSIVNSGIPTPSDVFELDIEKQNSEKKDYKKIYDKFKKRLENLGKDTVEESKKIFNTY